jgi:hypothetical protein
MRFSGISLIGGQVWVDNSRGNRYTETCFSLIGKEVKRDGGVCSLGEA